MDNDIDITNEERETLRGYFTEYGSHGILGELALWLEEVDDGCCAHMAIPIRKLMA